MSIEWVMDRVVAKESSLLGLNEMTIKPPSIFCSRLHLSVCFDCRNQLFLCEKETNTWET